MIRTRFAPSPTGFLHVGGVRTALFNWYYTKSQKGKFVLRIEDTDIERSKEEYENIIYDNFKWLGMEFDESPLNPGDFAPYKQSERLEIYKKYIIYLIEKEKAYYVIYDENGNEIESFFKKIPEQYKGNSFTVKFKVNKDKIIKWKDLLKGEISFNSSDFKDFVILRSNGIPVYNFTVVIDDSLMKITDIIRGEDHISNTPKQIMLYEALGFEKPNFGHLPLILGEDKTPLSKRHGGVSVTYFREEGILPEALLNYLSLLGWNNEEQIYSYKNKVEDFKIEDISNRSSIFDYEKLKWVNEKTIRKMNNDELLKSFLEWINYKNIILENNELFIKKVISISKEKIQDFKGLWEFSKNNFTQNFEYDEKYIKKYMNKDWYKELIKKSIEIFNNQKSKISIEEAEKLMKELAEFKITGKKNTYQSIRGALLGKLVTPGLYETIEVLGKEKIIERLEKALKEE